MNIIAVVVTFNRKELLARCLDALLNQSLQVQKIIVIDNASTDGTYEYLTACGYINNPTIDYKVLPENIGGAGGFNAGISTALAFNPTLVWLMDDDGWPSKDCLKELMLTPGHVKGPMIIDDVDNSKTAFSYQSKVGSTKEVAILDNEKYLNPIHPFNGVLLSRELINKIGLPDPRYFIWGDEIDYRFRWLNAGYDEKVIASAIFFHPSDRQIVKKGNPRSLGVPIDCSPLRTYCYYRNQTILAIKRTGILRGVGRILFTIVDVLTHEKKKTIFLKAVSHAIFRVHGKHSQYIGEKN